MGRRRPGHMSISIRLGRRGAARTLMRHGAIRPPHEAASQGSGQGRDQGLAKEGAAEKSPNGSSCHNTTDRPPRLAASTSDLGGSAWRRQDRRSPARTLATDPDRRGVRILSVARRSKWSTPALQSPVAKMALRLRSFWAFPGLGASLF